VKVPKIFKVNMRLRKGHVLSGRILHRGEKKYSKPGHVVHKKWIILCRFKKYKLTFVAKCATKSFWRREMIENFLFGALLGENI
jgi:hypothetical protein